MIRVEIIGEYILEAVRAVPELIGGGGGGGGVRGGSPRFGQNNYMEGSGSATIK